MLRCFSAVKPRQSLRKHRGDARSAGERALPQRVEKPEDLIDTIAFLMSDDSLLITGQTLLVDGGSAFD